MIGGKAAPGYARAKVIIHLINAVGAVINNDPEVQDLLKLIFLPNYNVSSAQTIIPAAELSQHISTAGTEASGTSNMKFVMNGCLIIGTMDGANVEIAEEIGQENMFIFGLDIEGVNKARSQMYHENKRDYYGAELTKVYEMIQSGAFGGDHNDFNQLICDLRDGRDHYLVSHDFGTYAEAQLRVDKAYKDQKLWNKMAITGVAKSGKFSSDRTIEEYAKDIWNIKSVQTPMPSTSANTRVRSFANLTGQ